MRSLSKVGNGVSTGVDFHGIIGEHVRSEPHTSVSSRGVRAAGYAVKVLQIPTTNKAFRL